MEQNTAIVEIAVHAFYRHFQKALAPAVTSNQEATFNWPCDGAPVLAQVVVRQAETKQGKRLSEQDY